MKLHRAVVLVTGAASGLGEATARHLHAQGAHVVLVDFNEEAGKKVTAELGERAAFAKADVSNAEQVQAAIDLARTFGPLVGAINCAGVAPTIKTAGKKGPHDLEAFEKTIRVNLIGSFNVARLSAQAMLDNTPNEEGERGVIINTASVAAYEGQIGQVAYAASKGGVVGMTLPMARDLSRDGVRVMTIAPGTFDTAMMASFSQEVRDALGAAVPFPSRLGRPSEYAALVQHIFENVMLNGEVIRLDGALRMPPR